ncbi:STE3-domain-containing protein [Agrocybe pediades]|nr:STE3-domain-containing protein [Agrocybe pediades]
MAYPNAIFSVFAFIGFLMSFAPFPWQPEAWSIGPCMYMIWTGVSCLNLFINSIIWMGNTNDVAPVWCDISAKLVIGASVGIPAASLTINRRLYYISTGQTASSPTMSRSQKRRTIMCDLAIALGIPVLEMALHYVVQGHRYDIWEDLGCWPTIYGTWLAYLLVFSPPLAIACISTTYGIRSMININRRRTEFNDLLSSHSNLTSRIYIRLMCLAATEAIGTISLSSLSLYLNSKFPLNPWISWEDTHFNFSRVEQIPARFWRSDPINGVNLELSRWLVVLCAFTFFAFFGFADEARKNYRILYRIFSGRFVLHQTSKLDGRDQPHSRKTPTTTSSLHFAYRSLSDADSAINAVPAVCLNETLHLESTTNVPSFVPIMTIIPSPTINLAFLAVYSPTSSNNSRTSSSLRR